MRLQIHCPSQNQSSGMPFLKMFRLQIYPYQLLLRKTSNHQFRSSSILSHKLKMHITASIVPFSATTLVHLCRLVFTEWVTSRQSRPPRGGGGYYWVALCSDCSSLEGRHWPSSHHHAFESDTWGTRSVPPAGPEAVPPPMWHPESSPVCPLQCQWRGLLGAVVCTLGHIVHRHPPPAAGKW